MDDLQLVHDHRAAVPPASTDELAPARARLLAAIDAEGRATAPQRRRRPVLGLAAAAVVVAGLAGGAIFASTPIPTPMPGPAPQPLTAAAVLRIAAAQVADQRVAEPRPDQFIYTKELWRDGRVREFWASADGTHDGLMITADGPFPNPGCRDGLRRYPATPSEPASADRCTPFPAFIPDLPTDPDAMLAYLHKSTHGEGDGPNSIGVEAHDLAAGLMRPAARAALYEALAESPEIMVREGVTDALGRPAIAVGWNVPTFGTLTEFLLDPITYAYLGTINGPANGGQGQDTDAAVVVQAVVDATGQRP
ncbi:CU044_5270 family protein [Pseudonocardia sp. TRM90224]|uniref:CU044_5270 family protein n=1 Tax=Pseudonocardia sp. TRM90224 TaxID=2812678 RepID=UPI001E52662E|nr:CU044_5270 family protein [Pseudonocardia sp. TRM90224]